jgi:isoquinoline 1-oxidoreductase alpha subunit
MRLTINGTAVDLTVDPAKPLLWVLREDIGLTGTKYGCGVGACGACTVHIDGEAVRSCILPVEAVSGAAVTTIEALGKSEQAVGRRVQQAWLALQVPQCGYCQSGMIMAVAALLSVNPKPTDAEIDESVTNICRCGTYPRIRKAIHQIAGEMETQS